MDTEIIKLTARIEKLEKAIFGSKKSVQKKPIINENSEASGPTGGIKVLVLGGFFSRQRSAAEVLSELEKKGYIGYQRQVIQNALNRMATKKGQLIASTNTGLRVYAKRK
jgi:cell division septation protein DedD